VTSRVAERMSGRRWMVHFIRAAIVVVVALVVIWRVNWSSARLFVHPSSWWFLLSAVLANFVSVGFKGLVWKGIIDGLPGLRQRTRYRDLLPPVFIGFLFNTVLAARLGELVKVALARRRLVARGEGMSATALLGTIVAENLIGTLMWVLLVIGIGIFLPLPLYAWIASLAIGAVAALIVGYAMMTATGHQPLPWLTQGSLFARAVRAASRLWGAVLESHLVLRSPSRFATVGGASLFTWFAQWAGIYCTLRAFGLGSVGWGGAGLLLVTITLAQAFPLLPGNLVIFQAAAVVPLTATYGVAASQAIAFSVVLQFTEIIVGVVTGFVFLLFEGVSFGQLRREAEAEAVGLERDEHEVAAARD
jgi:uncharacterized membrane protein YbhN (UPF0104 family)